MPEGDSLHRIAASLQPLVGERVRASSPHHRGHATGVAAAVDGRVLESAEAFGKHLVLRFEGGIVVRSHLRMRGRWRVSATDEPLRGAPWLALRGSRLTAAQWGWPVLELGEGAPPRLCPDVLGAGVTVDALVERIREADGRRRVGELLLDQRVVAGIGNLWMAEALWAARVSPWAEARSVPDGALVRALDWARTGMLRAVDGRRPPRAVHRRAGRPCRRCGAVVRTRGLGDANRTAYWCERCQGDAGVPASQGG